MDVRVHGEGACIRPCRCGRACVMVFAGDGQRHLLVHAEVAFLLTFMPKTCMLYTMPAGTTCSTRCCQRATCSELRRQGLSQRASVAASKLLGAGARALSLFDAWYNCHLTDAWYHCSLALGLC